MIALISQAASTVTNSQTTRTTRYAADTEVIGFYKGCILKYVWREQDKGGWEDLQKAEVYARRLNEFCARIGLSGDVPHDVSIGCARDTD